MSLTIGAASTIITPKLGTQIQGAGIPDQPARRIRYKLEANALLLGDDDHDLPIGAIERNVQRFCEQLRGADETTYFETLLNGVVLRKGKDVLAVEVHQWGGTSSDLGLDLELTGVAR